MSLKSTKTDSWPKINSIIALNAGTRLECDEGVIAIVPSLDQEVYAIVVNHHPAYDWRHDTIEVMIGSKIYFVLRTPPPVSEHYPYFNVREVSDG